MNGATAAGDDRVADTGPQARTTVVDDPIEQDRYTRWLTGPRGERLAESSLQIAGMHCAACSGIIERALAAVDGVRSARVSAAAERATVCWDPAATRPSALIDAVRAAGYGAVPDAAAPARALRRQEHRQALWRLFVATFCAMQVMMMATPSYVAGPPGSADALAPDLRQLLNWGSWLLALPVLLFSSAPYFAGAWRALRQRSIGMDVPVSLGVAITFVASTGATFDPGGVFGTEVYFDSMTMFVSFLLGARYLELHARHRAADALERSMSALPESACVVDDDGGTRVVSAQRLRAGDRVRVAVGDAFPADGVVESGATRADESLLSGESMPVDKAAGDAVIAGSGNVGAPVLVRVQRVGADTRLAAIVSMMRGAMTQRPAAARLADRWAAPFLWTVLLLAAGAAAAWSVIDPSRAVWVAVSVLIVTCPCALSIAAPSTLVAAARGLARRGVLLQRLDAVEALAAVDRVFFDKTGTLTEDRLQLRSVDRTDAGRRRFADDDAAVALAAQIASWSSHPAARAIVAAQAERAGQGAGMAPAAWASVREEAGSGVVATAADGAVWPLGSARWTGAAVDEADAGAARLFLARDEEVVAAFHLEERLREGVAQALDELRAQGIALTLLSGDSPARAAAVAARVGIGDVRAGASPQDKLDAIAAAQAAGECVAMVGDGINDAPVLARADVSLAMGQGALVSRSQADAVITSNRLLDVAAARRSARRAVAIVRQNLGWAAGYNAVSIPLALAGWLPPWAAGLGMAVSSLAVIANSLRAAR